MSKKSELKKKFNEINKKREYFYSVNFDGEKYRWEVCWTVGNRIEILEDYGFTSSNRSAIRFAKKSLKRWRKEDKTRRKNDWEIYKSIYYYDEEWFERQKKIFNIALILIFFSFFLNVLSLLFKIL